MGLGGGSLITSGLGYWSRIVNKFSDWWYKRLRNAGRNKLIDIKIVGNTKILIAKTWYISSNTSSPYQQICSIFGNSKNKINQFANVKANYKKQLLFNSVKATGKKDFKRLILELLLDDED